MLRVDEMAQYSGFEERPGYRSNLTRSQGTLIMVKEFRTVSRSDGTPELELVREGGMLTI